ncbi:MAG: universal stress protein [Haloarculaceae archaeon]
MYDRILVPTDGSEGATRAVDVAGELAETHEATLSLLYVADTNQPSLTNLQGSVRDVLEEEGEAVLSAATERVQSPAIDVTTDVVQGGPSRTILAFIDERGIDLTVMGTRGRRDLDSVVLGSVTDRVVTRSPRPVMTVAPDDDPFEYPPSDVLVATDGSDTATEAVREAATMAAATGATLHVLSVAETDLLGFDVRSATGAEGHEAALETVVEGATAVARDIGVEDVVGAMESGPVADEIGEYVTDSGIDLVFVGTSGRSGLDRRLLGSTASKLVRTLLVPVVTTPRAN